eukprot:gnl/TRDRNA2_/TRDRNA2_177223_c8_seq22.p3 gnl/TRDRNA2_/TRDRNA2_177223_c8~~gnl/TRDRNA2_/TRDRNA2_177223_c8_seq22.p3  ORF type:complete len:105 (-),score=2.64 gnl/TRDRNA2_/TRDRNA2_177223_c8_seq22:81-395(-)
MSSLYTTKSAGLITQAKQKSKTKQPKTTRPARRTTTKENQQKPPGRPGKNKRQKRTGPKPEEAQEPRKTSTSKKPPRNSDANRIALSKGIGNPACLADLNVQEW